MGIEKIFEESTKREEAVDEIRQLIRSAIDSKVSATIDEKYKKKVEEEEEEDEEEDEKDEEAEDEEVDVNEAFEVDAHPVGARTGQSNEKITINRISDLKKLARSRKYDYFMVKNRHGEETDYTVDPQGNLVEM